MHFKFYFVFCITIVFFVSALLMLHKKYGRIKQEYFCHLLYQHYLPLQKKGGHLAVTSFNFYLMLHIFLFEKEIYKFLLLVWFSSDNKCFDMLCLSSHGKILSKTLIWILLFFFGFTESCFLLASSASNFSFLDFLFLYFSGILNFNE